MPHRKTKAHRKLKPGVHAKWRRTSWHGGFHRPTLERGQVYRVQVRENINGITIINMIYIGEGD